MRRPRLATGEEREASRLELFYDLAYVLVVAELAAAFLHDLTWSGAAVFAGLFITMWLAWVSTTLYANRFDTDDVVFRIAQFIGTAAIAGSAAAATRGPRLDLGAVRGVLPPRPPGARRAVPTGVAPRP